MADHALPKTTLENDINNLNNPQTDYNNKCSNMTGSRQRQMIICENEPLELPDDIVRSDTKIDDGINNIKLNLNNILEKFERANTGEDTQASSPSVLIIEKPRFNIKQKLAAFENNQVMPHDDDDDSSSDEHNQKLAPGAPEKPVVRKLGNVTAFLNRNNNDLQQNNTSAPIGKLTVKRSESLMGRLRKFESRIAGQIVQDDSASSGDEQNNNNGQPDQLVTCPAKSVIKTVQTIQNRDSFKRPEKTIQVPKLNSQFDLSTLKNRWENGDIKNVSEEDDNNNNNTKQLPQDLKSQDPHHLPTNTQRRDIRNIKFTNGGDDKNILNSPMAEKEEELLLIRQQLAQRKKSGSVRNIYENAIREAEEQQKNQLASSRRDSSDLSALNGFSTSEIQQQLIQDKKTIHTTTLNSPIEKEHLQLNLGRKANKLKERFELGLINNNSHDDSDQSDTNEPPAMSKLEQIRQEKMEDLSVFTEGEVTAREARNIFLQIDRRLSSGGATGGSSLQMRT